MSFVSSIDEMENLDWIEFKKDARDKIATTPVGRFSRGKTETAENSSRALFEILMTIRVSDLKGNDGFDCYD
jgi:hypothetical protein